MNQTRRRFLYNCGLAGAAALAGATLPGAALAAPRRNLTMYGPPAGPSVIQAHLAETGALGDLLGGLDFEVYRNPDILRTGFVSGRWELAVTPSYVAANLHNKGIPVRLMNIMTSGLLYMVSTDPEVSSVQDLAGKSVVMPFKADMPDLVLQHIAAEAGMKAGRDYQLNYVANPFQALQLLLSGRADHAVLPEPAATAAQLRGLKSSRQLHRAIDLQQVWGEVTGGEAAIPQAGMMVSEVLVQAMPELPQRLNQALAESTRWVVNNPASAGSLGEAYLGMKAPVIEKSIPFSNFRLTPAAEGREQIQNFFAILAQGNPAIIGGKLPADDFYLA